MMSSQHHLLTMNLICSFFMNYGAVSFTFITAVMLNKIGLASVCFTLQPCLLKMMFVVAHSQNRHSLWIAKPIFFSRCFAASMFESSRRTFKEFITVWFWFKWTRGWRMNRCCGWILQQDKLDSFTLFELFWLKQWSFVACFKDWSRWTFTLCGFVTISNPPPLYSCLVCILNVWHTTLCKLLFVSVLLKKR